MELSNELVVEDSELHLELPVFSDNFILRKLVESEEVLYRTGASELWELVIETFLEKFTWLILVGQDHFKLDHLRYVQLKDEVQVPHYLEAEVVFLRIDRELEYLALALDRLWFSFFYLNLLSHGISIENDRGLFVVPLAHFFEVALRFEYFWNV